MEWMSTYRSLIALLIIITSRNICAIPVTENSSFLDWNSTETQAHDDTQKPLSPDVFRHLINQETLIRMTLVKNVNSIMVDMVTLKENMVFLQRKMNEVLESAKMEKAYTRKELKGIHLENKELKESIGRVDKELAVQNSTDTDLRNDINDYREDQKLFERKSDTLRESYERNTSALVYDLYNQVRVLAMSVINIDGHSQELSKRMDSVNSTIPETIDAKLAFVLDMTRNLTQTLSEGDRNLLKIIKDEIKETKQDHLKLSAALLSLEWQKDNVSTKCELQKRTTVAFTAGASSSFPHHSSGILVFRKVIFNDGDGYDSSSGIFTAPSIGVYVFYVSVTSYRFKYLDTGIYLNGVAQVTAKANGNGGKAKTQTGTNMVVLSLVPGDKVWVQWRSGDGFYSDKIPSTTFSGFLI